MQSKDILHTEPLGIHWKTFDPFLFCAHHLDHFPVGNGEYGPDPALLKGRYIGNDFTPKDGWRMYHGQKTPGFPVHPHRGFETITVVRKGFIDHTDSMHAAGRYGNGDVQWMTAGQGVQHAEVFPLIYEDKENTLELFQIWLNLPAEKKMVQPYFKMFWDEHIPKIVKEDTNKKELLIEVIAGSIDTTTAPSPPPDSWAFNPENQVAIWNIKMEAGAEFTLPKASKDINRTLYFYEGDDLNLNDLSLKEYHLAVIDPEASLKIKSTTESAILILQGKPINEPIAQYGPFVMNTEKEIQSTYSEFQKTQFGGWPWPSSEPNHGEKGRFAQYGDGRIETPK